MAWGCFTENVKSKAKDTPYKQGYFYAQHFRQKPLIHPFQRRTLRGGNGTDSGEGWEGPGGLDRWEPVLQHQEGKSDSRPVPCQPWNRSVLLSAEQLGSHWSHWLLIKKGTFAFGGQQRLQRAPEDSKDPVVWTKTQHPCHKGAFSHFHSPLDSGTQTFWKKKNYF